MSERNRSEGWQYAKLTGHENESTIKDLLNNDSDFFYSFSSRLGKNNISGSACVGGIREENVKCILGGSTKSKTDLTILYDDNSKINISIKKSLGGQVYLIKASRFIKGFEVLFNKEIPEEIKKAIFLFFGEDSDIDEYIEKYGEKNDKKISDYEKRKKRLVANSLKRYDNLLYLQLLNWFKINIKYITLFCFSTGLSNFSENYAQYIWYYNLLNENNIDDLINIDVLSNRISDYSNQISYGTRGGGTTINLPFGFVQWHQGQMQFHHSYDDISKIMR